MAFGRKAGALTCAVLLALLPCAGCSGETDAYKQYLTSPQSAADDDWQTAEGSAVLENDAFRLELDAETAHFTVTDRRSGKVYRSVPAEEPDTPSDETAARLQSELTVRYYEEQSDAQYMYSYTDCVAQQAVTVTTDGTAIRVTYALGAVGQFVPQVMDEATFQRVLEELGSEALSRRFERYYTAYAADDPPEDYEEQCAQYPVLKKQTLYILDSEISDVDRDDIVGYLEQTSFTQEDYQQMLAQLGIEQDGQSEAAGFRIPVEYRLTEDGFTATVLTDRIEETSSEYKLQQIDLLEYFAAANGTQGQYLVPDGSGALIPFSNGSAGLTAPYYGEDYAVRTEGVDQFSKNLSLPVFGADFGDSGFLAVIEQAAETASLNVYPTSEASPLNHAYASFAMRSIDITDYGAKMSIPIYNLFSMGMTAASPSVRYMLLPAGECDYASMAQRYRRYLTDNGTLSGETAVSPVCLDFLCMITEDASVLGIPYTKRTVLSTVDEITQAVQELKKTVSEPISVRLIGYGPDGYEHGAYTRYALDKRVGTTAQLQELQKLLEADGGRLYLDADMQFAFRRGGGFSRSRDTARYLNRMVVCRGNHDIVTREYDADTLLKYFLSPVRYAEQQKTWSASLKKAFGDALPGISYGSSGAVLGGDYTKARDIDRTETVQLLTQALGQSREDGLAMAFDTGNEYVLPYAAQLLNVPAVSSLSDAENACVPFYEMVVYGRVPYALTPQNLAADGTVAQLKTAALGASPYGVFITREDALLIGTPYETMVYSLGAAGRLQAWADYVAGTASLRQAIRGADFTGFAQLSATLTRSDFSNGVSIYVNYANTDVTVDGTTVPAHGSATGGR